MRDTAFLIALLDSGPLSLVTHPKGGEEAQEYKDWLAGILADGHMVLVPEICYYEVRRELKRAELRSGTPSEGLAKLDSFAEDAGVVPITSEAMRLAGELWAETRHRHQQGAPDPALDADMILCAQARLINPNDWDMAGGKVVIATGNLKHLENFAAARHWRQFVER